MRTWRSKKSPWIVSFGDMFDIYQVPARVERYLTLDEESMTDRIEKENSQET